MSRPQNNSGSSIAALMNKEARRLGEQRIGRIAGPQQLRAVVLAIAGTWLPEAPDTMSRQSLGVIAGKLRRALARERGKARSGHRSYDVNRHIALHQALRGLEQVMRGKGTAPARRRDDGDRA